MEEQEKRGGDKKRERERDDRLVLDESIEESRFTICKESTPETIRRNKEWTRVSGGRCRCPTVPTAHCRTENLSGYPSQSILKSSEKGL